MDAHTIVIGVVIIVLLYLLYLYFFGDSASVLVGVHDASSPVEISAALLLQVRLKTLPTLSGYMLVTGMPAQKRLFSNELVELVSALKWHLMQI